MDDLLLGLDDLLLLGFNDGFVTTAAPLPYLVIPDPVAMMMMMMMMMILMMMIMMVVMMMMMMMTGRTFFSF